MPYEDDERLDHEERQRFLVDEARKDAFQILMRLHHEMYRLFTENELATDEERQNPHRKIGFGFTVENRGEKNMRCVPTMNIETYKRRADSNEEWGKRREIEVNTIQVHPEIVLEVLQHMQNENLETLADYFLMNSLDFWTDVTEAEDPSYESTAALRAIFEDQYRQLTGLDMPDITPDE